MGTEAETDREETVLVLIQQWRVWDTIFFSYIVPWHFPKAHSVFVWKQNISILALEFLLFWQSDWTICWFDSDKKTCLYPITWLLSYPLCMSNGTRVIMLHTFYSIVCKFCKYYIGYQTGQSFDLTIIGNPFCCSFYPLLVLEWVLMSSSFFLSGEIGQMLWRTKNICLQWDSHWWV